MDMTMNEVDSRAGSPRSVGRLIVLAGLVWLAAAPAIAQQGGCTRPLPDPVMFFDVPGGLPTPTRDGCWIFSVFMENTEPPVGSGIALLHRTESGVELHRSLALNVSRTGAPKSATPIVIGIALTHDDKLLVVSHNERITFIDVRKMIEGAADPVLGYIESPRLSRSWGVVVSRDDKYAYAAQQGTALVVIVDLDKIRHGTIDQSALVGMIPTAEGATTPVISADGRYIYTTTLRAPDGVDAPLKCRAGTVVEGSIHVADVQRARTDPASATLGFAFPAGCNPIFAWLSPDGRRLSVAAAGPVGGLAPPRNESSVTVFDTTPVSDGTAPALIGKLPMPEQTVNVADTGDRLFVGFKAPRLNPPTSTNVMVLDAARLAEGKAAILGRLPFSAMTLRISSDGRTLYGASAEWTKLAVVDLQRLKLDPATD